MSAEPRRIASPEVWTRWEGQVIKGRFPLRRFLGGSEQGAVFLTEYDAGKTSDVAIKIVPVAASQAEARLAHWRAAAALTHPNLVRLYDMGRCQLGGREYLFVVMEYGEQTLAQFLAQRALSAGEVRALLLPTLSALAFLHGSQLVHAQLKPSNFLVVDDTLKLSSDVVRPVGHRGVATADDIRSLGLTLIEAFTQRTPSLPDAQDEVNLLLTNVPAQFANIVRRCLNPTAASRPTVSELQSQFESAGPAEVTSDEEQRAHPVLLAIPAVLLFSLAVWIALHPSGKSQADMQPPAAVPAPEPAAKTQKAAKPASKPTSRSTSKPTSKPAATTTSKPNPKPAAIPSAALSDASPVVFEVTPEVPRALSDKIQGRILVRMRVLVDASGNVVAAMMENAGPNRNLANLADGAAREWKFVPSENQDTRVWILTFAFTQEGVTARASAV